jgi:serine/threonine protein kinase/Tfp pilus assembly protein PilF
MKGDSSSPPPPEGAGGRSSWEDLFDELVELPAAERCRRLAALRAEDGALADRIERLLAADAASAGLLDLPAPVWLGQVGDAAEGGEGAEGSAWGDPAGRSAPGAEQGAEVEPQLSAGAVVGSWRIVRPLGRGGMGEVYLAERSGPEFAQRVALKVIKRGMDSAAIVRRFVRERQILAHLDHPNLARLLDGGSTPDGRPYFALELVEGEPITAWCERHEVGLEGRLRLVQTVCQAVDSAHRRLVVHRDLKPANILVTADGTPKLLDFGIAKLLAPEEGRGETLTHLEGRVLTPAYAAPEQILGEPVSTATDVYALGVLLYELITGILPHRRDQRGLGALATAVGQETVERPSAVLRRRGGENAPRSRRAGETSPRSRRAETKARLARRVAGDLDLLVLTALRRDPARRYLSAQALADDLGHFLAGRPLRARPDEIGYRVRKFVGRHRVPVAAVAVGLAALLAGLALSLWQAHSARLAARRADAEAQRAERVKSFLISVFRQSDPEAGDGAKLTASELLERGAAGLDKGLAGQPRMQADLLDAVTRIETNLGLLDPALAHGRRALDLRRAALPPADGRIGLSLTALGDVQVMRGDLGAARKTAEAALAVLIPAYGADSVEVAAARRELASAVRGAGDDDRMVELLRQALAAFSRRLGENDQDTAETLDQLGTALEMKGQYAEAEADLRRSARIFRRTLGPHSVRVASVEADLAGLLDRMGRTAEARPLFERAIATDRATLGPHHVRLADLLFSYGVLLNGEQEYSAADRAFTEALSIYGSDRFESAHCLRYLGLSAMGQERFAEAADLFARAVEKYRAVLSNDEPQRWRALANLGWAHFHLGRVAAARAELTSAITAIERLAGRDAYELRLPLEQLGQVLTATGDVEDGIAMLRRVRALEEKLFGTAEHREVAGTDLQLARALLARGAAHGSGGGNGSDAREARRWLDEGLGIFARKHPKDVMHGESLLESGRLALAGGDRVRARRDLAAAEPLLAAGKGAAHPQTREARQLLASANAG